MPRRKRDHSACGLCLLALAVGLYFSIGTSGFAAEWGRYVNSRFGTSVDLPKHVFAGPPATSANGDGATFRASDGGVLRVWGARHLADFPLSDLADMALEGPAGYRRVMADGYVVSGAQAGRIAYQRCRLSRAGLLHCLRLDYPESRKAAFDPLVTRMSGSLSGP